ncbi:hypothetical protein [Chamaesiphon polymorphus]|uniref:hypothetical protein n=1 Tax=Chamaesiphon polymorphus TaxID=2107691 RepID=UPI0011B27061|nr:hypothetical protein [Chamaesiphon polymorphus]
MRSSGSLGIQDLTPRLYVSHLQSQRVTHRSSGSSIVVVSKYSIVYVVLPIGLLPCVWRSGVPIERYTTDGGKS